MLTYFALSTPSTTHLTRDQIESEIEGCLDFVASVYRLFGFKFELELSTRPESYLGDVELWDRFLFSTIKPPVQKIASSGP